MIQTKYVKVCLFEFPEPFDVTGVESSHHKYYPTNNNNLHKVQMCNSFTLNTKITKILLTRIWSSFKSSSFWPLFDSLSFIDRSTVNSIKFLLHLVVKHRNCKPEALINREQLGQESRCLPHAHVLNISIRGGPEQKRTDNDLVGRFVFLHQTEFPKDLVFEQIFGNK